MIKDAHNALLDIQSSGRAKELLGQGLLMRNMQERNAEQEKIEKRRQVSPTSAANSCPRSFPHAGCDLAFLSMKTHLMSGCTEHCCALI